MVLPPSAAAAGFLRARRQAEAAERELLAMRLQPCDRPIRHWETHPNQLRDWRSRD
jgi:hypothetical protein